MQPAPGMLWGRGVLPYKIISDTRVGGTGRLVYVEYFAHTSAWECAVDANFLDGALHGRTRVAITYRRDIISPVTCQITHYIYEQGVLVWQEREA